MGNFASPNDFDDTVGAATRGIIGRARTSPYNWGYQNPQGQTAAPGPAMQKVMALHGAATPDELLEKFGVSKPLGAPAQREAASLGQTPITPPKVATGYGAREDAA